MIDKLMKAAAEEAEAKALGCAAGNFPHA